MQNDHLVIGTLTLANPFILAPMAGITDLPYRLIHKTFGAGMVTTEMVSANGLVFQGDRTFELLQTLPEEQPLAIQLFGSDPQRLAEAARLAEPHGALIDINLGCPVRKVVGTGAGSALLQDPERVSAILQAVRRAVRLPLTIKIRSGWDSRSVNYREIAQRAVDAGVDAITLHPRTRSQMFSGRADWSQLTDLVRQVSVPVIGSGDIFCAEDGLRMLRETGCAGVMIGRGGYGNPWIFRQLIDLLAGRTAQQPTLEDRRTVARRHIALAITHLGEHKAVLDLRKHLCWYVKGLPGATTFRARLQHLLTAADLEEAIDTFFCHSEGTAHGDANRHC